MDKISLRKTVLITVVLMAAPFSLMMSIGLVSTLLVDISRDLNTTVAAVGQLLTVSAIISAVGAPVVGPLSDRLGRKRLLVAGLITTGIGVLGYSISTNFIMLVGFSVIIGMGSCIVFPNTLASIGDYFPVEKRGRILGIVLLGITLAVVGGLPLGALVANRFGWHWSFLGLGLLFFIVAITFSIVFPKPGQVPPSHHTPYLSMIKNVLRKKHIMSFISTNIFMEGGYQLIEVYLIAFIMLHYSLNIGQVAPLISLMAIGQFAGAIFGGQMADRFNRVTVCAATAFTYGIIGLALVLYPQHLWLTVLLGGIFKLTYGSNRPAYFALVVSLSEKERGTITA
ncbi:MAG: MFS transporter, partial [Dehalococcoidia bacterium]